MLLFRAWWRRGEKERRGVEVVSSCIFLVLPPWKQMQWFSEMFGAGGDLLVQRGCLAPLPRAPWKCGLGPPAPRRCWGSCRPPRLTLVSQASRREFLLHCALVVLGNADLKSSGSGSAVGEEIPALAPRWPRRWHGLSWRWAASSFLPGLSWNRCGIPISSSCLTVQSQVTERTDYKVPVEFFKVFRFFLSFHPISWSSSVHSLVNNSGKPQAAKSDPCIFSDAEGI